LGETAGEGGDTKPDGRAQTEWAIFFFQFYTAYTYYVLDMGSYFGQAPGRRPSCPRPEPAQLSPILSFLCRILIVEINLRQLAPTVVILGIGVMDLTTFSHSSKSNSKIDGNKITFKIALLQGLGIIVIFLILIYAPYEKKV
jgi:hypothetical protein